MAVDVAGRSADYAVTGTQEGRDGHQIRLGGAGEEMDFALGALAQVQDHLFCLITPFIGAITAELGIVGADQGFQDVRMGPVVVVIVESDHDTSSLKNIYPLILS